MLKAQAPTSTFCVIAKVEISSVPLETVKALSPLRSTARAADAELLAMVRKSKIVGAVLPPIIESPLPVKVTMAPVPSKAPLLIKLPVTLK